MLSHDSHSSDAQHQGCEQVGPVHCIRRSWSAWAMEHSPLIILVVCSLAPWLLNLSASPFLCQMQEVLGITDTSLKKSSINESERVRREKALGSVFKALDPNVNGDVDSNEVWEIARLKRLVEIASGLQDSPWSAQKRDNLMARLDPEGTGNVQLRNFMSYFMERWQGGMEALERQEFDDTCEFFLNVAGSIKQVSRSCAWHLKRPEPARSVANPPRDQGRPCVPDRLRTG